MLFDLSKLNNSNYQINVLYAKLSLSMQVVMNPQFGAPNFVLTNFHTSGEVTATSELLIPAIGFSSLQISSSVRHLRSIVSTGTALARATNRGLDKGRAFQSLKVFMKKDHW